MTTRLRTLKPRLATLGTPTRSATPKPLWTPDSARGSRHQRGYGWAWEKLRANVLERDCGLCQPCLKAKRTTLATAVDHITPKAHGGTDDESNLQAICKPCHDAKSRGEMTATRGGGSG